jgi:hypothetical protein
MAGELIFVVYGILFFLRTYRDLCFMFRAKAQQLEVDCSLR